MNFQFTPQQEEFRVAVRRFAERHLKAGARERAHSTEYPWDVAKLMATQRLLGITMAEADGGQGGTLMDAVIAIETVASVCPRSADVVQVGNFGPVRVMGGMGYSQEALIEYCVRRCRGWMIAGGSIEILKNRIAETVFGRAFSQRPS